MWKPFRNIGILGFNHKVWAKNKLLVYTTKQIFFLHEGNLLEFCQDNKREFLWNPVKSSYPLPRPVKQIYSALRCPPLRVFEFAPPELFSLARAEAVLELKQARKFWYFFGVGGRKTSSPSQTNSKPNNCTYSNSRWLALSGTEFVESSHKSIKRLSGKTGSLSWLQKRTL